mgnify:FL=1
MDANQYKIRIVTTQYEGNDFPEADSYPQWLADQISQKYPGAEVEVDEGPTQWVSVRHSQPDDSDLDIEGAIGGVLPAMWDSFCSYGYQEFSDTSAQ